jgi:hypothetical protein
LIVAEGGTEALEDILPAFEETFDDFAILGAFEASWRDGWLTEVGEFNVEPRGDPRYW